MKVPTLSLTRRYLQQRDCIYHVLTPGKVLDDAMGIQLDPDVEKDQDESSHPTKQMAKEASTSRESDPGQSKADIGCKVVHQDQIDQLAVEQPGVELDGRGLD